MTTAAVCPTSTHRQIHRNVSNSDSRGEFKQLRGPTFPILRSPPKHARNRSTSQSARAQHDFSSSETMLDMQPDPIRVAFDVTTTATVLWRLVIARIQLMIKQFDFAMVRAHLRFDDESRARARSDQTRLAVSTFHDSGMWRPRFEFVFGLGFGCMPHGSQHKMHMINSLYSLQIDFAAGFLCPFVLPHAHTQLMMHVCPESTRLVGETRLVSSATNWSTSTARCC